MYHRISEREISKSHTVVVDAFLSNSEENDISNYVNQNVINLRKMQEQKNIVVFKRIFAVIIFIGTQSLAYRGHHHKSGYSLADKTINHGNFLELVLPIAEFNVPMRQHIDKVIVESKCSKNRLAGDKSLFGGGGIITIMSKTTVNIIIDAIRNIIKDKSADEIGQSKFSVQMDGSQDTSAIDQETIITRYVINKVKEKLFAVKKITNASSEGLFNMLKDSLEAKHLKVANIVGESFDGAVNMRSGYRGIQRYIKDYSPNSDFMCAIRIF